MNGSSAAFLRPAAPFVRTVLLAAATTLLYTQPAGAQILRPGDLAEAWQILECGWSDSSPAIPEGPEVNVHASAGALVHGGASAPEWEVPWQFGGHVEGDRGCYRSARGRAEVFGTGADAPGIRAEAMVPLGMAIPFSPEPGHAEEPRFLRLVAVVGAEAANSKTFAGLGAERQRAWAGLAGASPQLTVGWGGTARLLGRVVLTAQAEAYAEDRVRPRVGLNVPLALQRWQAVGLLVATDRVYDYQGDADLERRSLTLVFSPLSGASDNLAVALQGADRKLGPAPRRGQVGLYVTFIQNLF